MANITVTYSNFTNGSTADADQIDTNFADIIAGTSDSTKDFSISALTCAGAATFNGTVTLGNASGDDITFTGSLASSIPIKTHNTYDIGSVTTLGLRAIYMASSGSTKTAKIIAQNNTADIICTLPIYTGTLRHVPSVIASQTGTYAVLASDEFIPVSVSGGAFTATLPTAVGITGKVYTFKRTDQTLGTAFTIATTSSQTIDGVTTTTLDTQYEQVTVISDGSNWHIIDRHIPGVWTAYTPTGSWSSNVTYTGYWRRVRDSIEVQILITASGATTGTLSVVKIPTGLTSDSAKIIAAASGFYYSSLFTIRDSGSATYFGFAHPSPGTIDINVGYLDASATGGQITATAPMTWANGDTMALSICVPVTGWKG